MPQAFESIRILDFSQVVSGPYAVQLLGNQGTEVVKVEPGRGDQLRKIFKMGSEPADAFPCSDGHIAVSAVTRAQGRTVLELAGLDPDLWDEFDPENPAAPRSQEIADLVRDAFRKRPMREWEARLRDAGQSASCVLDAKAVAGLDKMARRGHCSPAPTPARWCRIRLPGRAGAGVAIQDGSIPSSITVALGYSPSPFPVLVSRCSQSALHPHAGKGAMTLPS
ncbi:MAG: hypothetical protein F4027_13840 [Rhodospirillaceae bacterium]|nr:hypothetical protein [Rhodospirillaceae bacterium]MYH38097.1 hypothetical protein [Rhodospirillaceae bacterium]MYK15401.1 hypothetical protein [Rhodospirillaceae bacterium]MYK59621.1 hypothetical protein [Rhodospirillaceae bacterium]